MRRILFLSVLCLLISSGCTSRRGAWIPDAKVASLDSADEYRLAPSDGHVLVFYQMFTILLPDMQSVYVAIVEVDGRQLRTGSTISLASARAFKAWRFNAPMLAPLDGAAGTISIGRISHKYILATLDLVDEDGTRLLKMQVKLRRRALTKETAVRSLTWP